MKRIFAIILSLFLSLALSAQIFNDDTIKVCHVDSLLLDAGTGFDSYQWNTGSSEQSIYAKRTLMYEVSAFLGAIETKDSVFVDIINTSIVQNDTIICYNDSITLSLKNIEPYCLKGLYPIDGDGTDLSGNGNHGGPLGVVPFSNRFNENAKAGFFNPTTSSRIMIAHNPTLELTDYFTISAWINPSEGWGAGAPDGEYYIIDKWRTILPSESAFILGVTDGGNLFFRTTDGVNSTDITAPQPLTIEDWVHVVVVMENGHLSMYLGDVTGIALVDEIDNAAVPVITPTDIYIGAAVITNDHNFKGGIDDVRLYQCALSAFEIETLNRVNMTYDMTFLWSDESTDSSLRVGPKEATWYFVDIDDGINHCSDSVYIDVYPELTIAIDQIGKGCPGSIIGALHAGVTGGIPFEIDPASPRSPYLYSWSPIVYNYDSIALKLAEGDYTVTIVDSVGCSIKETGTVEAYDPPGVEAEADPTSIYIQNPAVSFSSTSDNAISWMWNFGDTTFSTEQNPKHIYESLDFEQDIYDVWVYVEDGNGCIDSLTIPMDVKTVELHIPNVFTPNKDGINEYFEIEVTGEEGKGIDQIYLSSQLVVFNRYGQKVFEDNDYSGFAGSSWDGGNHKDGAYFYTLKCKGFFKEDIYTGIVHILTQPPKE